jgi:hypothetical protein
VRKPIVALLLLLLAGCTTTRYVTPWLRTTVHEPFVIIAESGGPKRTSMTEIDVRGSWRIVSHQSQALALPDDDRAIFVSDAGLALAEDTGETTPLDCPGHVRVDSDRKRIVCLAFESWVSVAIDDVAVSITTIDYRTGKRSRRTSTVRGQSLPRSYFPHFAGFLQDGTPVLTVHVNAPDEVAGTPSKLCAAFALRDTFATKLASIESSAWPDCDEASFWNRRTELEVEPGEALR